MKLSTALRLARPVSAANRGRFVLTAGSVAGAGALVLAALHILRMPVDAASGPDLANYVTESGLRGGVVFAAMLLTVPVLAFTVQALRVGSVARDRRMASLRLAGATPRDARTIAGLEAGGAAIAGGLLAGPAYLLLWLVVGVLPPGGARMLDTPDALDLIAWAGLLPLAAVAGALAGAAIHGRAVVEPLGVQRRSSPPAPGRASLAVLIAGVVLVLAGIGIPMFVRNGPGAFGLIGLLLVAIAGGPRLVLASAHVLQRRRGAEALLASRRLQADPRSAGRVAGVLVVCGLVLGVESVLMTSQFLDGSLGGHHDDAFYLTGYGMTALAVLVAAAVALLTLLVGAADGLLDARRPLATLAVLGVDERALVRVLARQLSATAVPAVVIGVLLGGPGISLLVGFSDSDARARGLLVGAATAVVAALALGAVAQLAARLLRPLIRSAIDPENLRVA